MNNVALEESRQGHTVSRGEHYTAVMCGQENMFSSADIMNAAPSWVDALEGLGTTSNQILREFRRNVLTLT